jgi:hypothetical protein
LGQYGDDEPLPGRDIDQTDRHSIYGALPVFLFVALESEYGISRRSGGEQSMIDEKIQRSSGPTSNLIGREDIAAFCHQVQTLQDMARKII